MAREEQVREKLISRFNLEPEKITVTRERRVFCEIPKAIFHQAFEFIVLDLGFGMLPGITGLDEASKLSAVYHLADWFGTVLSLKVSVDKDDPVLESVMPYFPSAEVYERELEDLLGFKVNGLPTGSRYPLTDDWPKGEYPLRKDWHKSSS